MKTEESIVHSTNWVREKAACPVCGFERVVYIGYFQRIKITYQVADHTNSNKWFAEKTEISREPIEEPERGSVPRCKACDYISRAEVHEHAAFTFRAKAREIFEKRKERKTRSNTTKPE